MKGGRSITGRQVFVMSEHAFGVSQSHRRSLCLEFIDRSVCMNEWNGCDRRLSKRETV